MLPMTCLLYTSSLQKNYDAIFIAIGAHKTLHLGIPGEDLEGVYHGLDFLKRVILKKDLDLSLIHI